MISRTLLTTSIMVVLALLIAGCPGVVDTGGGSSEGGSPSEEELAIAEVTDSDSDMAIVVGYEDGDKVAVFAEKAADGSVIRFTGSTYMAADGRTQSMWFNADGLPSEILRDGWLIRLTNYTESTVDVIVTSPTGETTLHVAQPIDPELLAEAHALGSQESKLRFPSSKIGSQLKYNSPVARGIKIATTIGLNVACGVGVLSFWTGVGAAGLLACPSALLADVGHAVDDPAFDDALTTISAVDCGAGSRLSCGLLLPDMAARFIEDDYNRRQDGSYCDGDLDGDGVGNCMDNCPSYFNPAPQIDSDGDGVGDQCDSTPFGDEPVCGNGICEAGETSSNCPTDCGGPVCGNGICEAGETSSNCPTDCGGPICGNGICEAGETSSNCPVDCGGNGHVDYFQSELATGNIWYYDPDGDYHTDHRPYFRLDYLDIPEVVAPSQTVNGAAGWTVVTSESSGAVVYKTLLAEWSPNSPIAWIQTGELDGSPRSINENFSFTAPSTPGVYRIRMAATWAYEGIESFYGDGPKGDSWNPGVGDYTEVQIEVQEGGTHVDYFQSELAAGNIWYYDPDGDYYTDHRPYFRLDYLDIPEIVAPGQTVNGSAGWTVVSSESSGAVVYKTLLAEWSPNNPIAWIQTGELDGSPRSINENFSFTAPSTPGVYRIRMAATWAYEGIESFYGDGPKGDSWNPGVGDYTEVQIGVAN